MGLAGNFQLMAQKWSSSLPRYVAWGNSMSLGFSPASVEWWRRVTHHTVDSTLARGAHALTARCVPDDLASAFLYMVGLAPSLAWVELAVLSCLTTSWSCAPLDGSTRCRCVGGHLERHVIPDEWERFVCSRQMQSDDKYSVLHSPSPVP
jgi:hypothetical protein